MLSITQQALIFRLSLDCEAFMPVGDEGSREAMGGAKPDDRAERLKAALRENLRRRKAQARGREATEKPQIDDRLAPDPSRGKA